MEKVYLNPQKERMKEFLSGQQQENSGRARNIITSLDLDSIGQEEFNHKLQAKYDVIRDNEVRYEEFRLMTPNIF